MPLFDPVTLSVSASISILTSLKSTNFLPLQCRNSAHSTEELTNCSMRGLRVTIPEPRGKKSLRK